MAFPIHAQSAVALNLTTIGERVRTHNPELAAAKLRIEEAASRVKQSGRLPNPNLETAFERDASFDEHKLEVGFTQRFPITHRLRLEKTISSIELRAAESEVREIERQLISQARETAVKLLAIRQQQALLRNQNRLMRQFAETLSDSAEKGEASALDAGQAKLDAATLEIRSRELESEQNIQLGTLKPLLGIHSGETIAIEGALTAPEIPHINANLSQRPDLQKAELALQSAVQQVALEKSRRYDDIEGGLFASSDRSEDAPEGFDTETMVELRLKIPLPFWNQNTAAIEEAKIRKTRIENEAIALARKIGVEAETAQADMKQWASLAREIKDSLLPLAEQQAQAAETAYASGQTEIRTLLTAKQKHLELDSSHIDALREFHLARIRHETALGNP
ncbi:MAG: hypothetical protein RLZ22_1458 [Verrucomicrobiota bacterium]|jgi:cobalt-zinc-cadmium efflux system outer membrane protein